MLLRQSVWSSLKRLKFACLFVTALASSGCASSIAPAAPPAATATSGPPGELTYVVPTLSSGVETFDPSKTVNVVIGPGIGGPIFEQLYAFYPPKGDVRPFLLESGTMASDGMSWTLKLHDGIKFSNGDPMTSADVKFSFDRFLSPESTSASGPTLRQAVASVTVVDNLTVRLGMKQPLVDLPYVLTYPGNDGIVLPSKYIQQVGWDEFAQKPIGSGPYVVTDHKPGESVTYEANAAYWRSQPSLKQINLLKVPEEQTRISMLKSGKADLVEINASSKDQVEGGSFKVLAVPNASTFMVYFDGEFGDYPDTPIKKPEVRRALTLALDKKALLQVINAGQGEVANYGPSAPNDALGSPTLPTTPYDPQQATQLLQQAGYPNGFTLKLWTPEISTCNTEIAKQFGEALAGYWQKIGVTTQVTPISYSQLRPKIQANPFADDVVGTGFTYCLGAQEAARDLASNFYSKGTMHLTNVADTEVEQMLRALNFEEQHRQAAAAYQKVYDSYVGIATFYAARLYAGDQQAIRR